MAIPISIAVAIAIPISRETYYKELSHTVTEAEKSQDLHLEDQKSRWFSRSASLSLKAGEYQCPSLKTGGESEFSYSALDSIPAFRG